MSNLRQIRKRLQSVQKIQQLTKAMEMVAASRLHFAQVVMEHSRRYAAEIKHILARLNLASLDFMPPLLQQKETKKIGLVIIAGKMGLCGSYNYDVFKAANKFLNSIASKDVELILVGRQAINYYSKRSWPIRAKLWESEEKHSISQIRAFASELVSSYLSNDLDEVWFAYTHYINLMARKAKVEKLLNLELADIQTEAKASLDYLLEPDSVQIYQEVLLQHCLAKIQVVFNDAYVSELSARIFAMKTATNNAGEMLEKLTLLRNRLRQAGITKEMLEISSGVEGLK